MLLSSLFYHQLNDIETQSQYLTLRFRLFKIILPEFSRERREFFTERRTELGLLISIFPCISCFVARDTTLTRAAVDS